MITIIDYGMGNLGSVLNMFKRLNVPAKITSDADLIANSKKILLPGVGAFDNAMNSINNSGLREILDHKAIVERVHVLGICLGMQLLTRSSEEGECAGLGWVQASTYKFPPAAGLKVPHMGWNVVKPTRRSELTKELFDKSRFYFVHSYYVKVENENNSILKTHHGITFDSAIQNQNIYGAQFHPEKSHKFGMHLLKNFANL